MKRVTLAMTLGFGLAISGCGETPPADVPTNTGTTAPAASPEQKGGLAGDVPAGTTPKSKVSPGMGGGMVPGYPLHTEAITKDGKPIGGVAGPDGKASPSPAGKDEKKEDEAKKDEPKKDEPKKDEASKSAGITLSEAEIAAIKKLPEADQSAALAQKVCLVQEDDDGKPNHLGAMGTPVKKVIKGKTVFLCCKGCIEDLEKDPDKYLAKLSK